MESLCKNLMLGGSIAAILASATAVAYAQDNKSTESVTVSASRIQVEGYEAATPVTVIGAAQLERDAKVDIGDSIRELPSVGISDAPGNGSHSGNASQGDAGLSTINLRGLGVVRTLVLFDGQRVGTSNPNASGPPAIGGVDMLTIPTSLIERVDIVTGGASAAWGSDAVAGVVNLVINKHYSGFKTNMLYGNSSYNDRQNYKAEMTAGTDFMGGRGHTEFAATYSMSPNAMFSWNRPWYNNVNATLFPCGLLGKTGPTLCRTTGGAYSSAYTNGGIISSSPQTTGANQAVGGTGTQLAANISAINALGVNYPGLGANGGVAANFLKGNQFVGPNANVVPFNYGINANNRCISCSADQFSNIANPPLIGVPYHTTNLFSYTSYRLTDDISVSLMLNYGANSEQNQANNGRISTQKIGIDNPFIPSSIRQQMIDGAIPSISVNTNAMGNMRPGDVTLKNYEKAVAQNYIQNYRQLMRGVFTLFGSYRLLGQDWTWNAYAQNTSVRERQYAPYNTYNQNFSNSIDAVTVTSTGKNSLGNGNAALAAQVTTALNLAGAKVPQVGDVACRSALSSTSWGTQTNAAGFQVIQPGGLAAGCIPMSLFGEANTSQAALNYVAPGRVNKKISDQSLYLIGQSVFAASASGTLPWGLPAGKVALALGAESRLEQMRITRDPLQLGATGVFHSGNFAQYAGQYNVQEGFLEVNVPVLKNQFVDSLEFNAAARITNYSTSGMVETWKLGATSQLNEDIKLRTTLSSDIRAPGIGELFSNPLISTQNIAYPGGGNPATQNYNVKFGASGNSALKPEQSTTVSGGIVLTPHWIENLSLSMDYYSITLHQGIFAPSGGVIFDQCANKKQAAFCSLVFFGQGYPGNGNTPVAKQVDGNGVSPGLSGPLGTFSADSEGAFNFYIVAPVNANRETVSGVDLQADYNHELLDGIMTWRVVSNYTDDKTRTQLGITSHGAGAVSGDGAVNPLTGFTTPKFRGTFISTYAQGAWSVTAQTRIIGSAKLSNEYTQGIHVDNNAVPGVIYGDVRASYAWNDNILMYGAVDNLFNGPPPAIPTSVGGGTDCRIYDCIGRVYRIGVRVGG